MGVEVLLAFPVLDQGVAVLVVGVLPQLVQRATVFFVGFDDHVVEDFDEICFEFLLKVEENVESSHGNLQGDGCAGPTSGCAF